MGKLLRTHWVPLAVAFGLVTTLALLGWRHHADQRNPITREFNELVADFQARFALGAAPDASSERGRPPAWPLVFLAGAAATLVVERVVTMRQKRSRSNSS